MRDLILWEPGETLVCVLCGGERGGQNPPGEWQRAYSTSQRRVPIYGPGNTIVGHMEYTRL